MIDWRKRFEYPRPGAVWCDECLRFETGSGRFDSVARPRLVRVLEVLAGAARYPGNRLAGWLTDRAEEAQVRANIRNGVFDVVHPEREPPVPDEKWMRLS